jgi:DNA-binding transcriptional ArsR family regulator
MSRLLPFKSEPTRSPEGARILSLEDEATEDALSALSSDTAREVLALIYEEPRTPPEIRDAIDTSLQNVHYHLENLEEADLIQPAGSGYSEKGTEMTVYAPASEAVVLFAGAEDDGSRIQTALARLLGAVGLLALASIAVRRVARTTLPVGGLGGEGAAEPSSQSEAATDAQGGEDAGAGDGGSGGGDMGAFDQEATPTP